jgi:ADP-glucose pyrophosphorylase
VRFLLKMLESCDNRAGGGQREGSPLRPEAPALLASMGSYLFRLAVLREVLGEDAQRQSTHDLGRAILPGIIGCTGSRHFPSLRG